MGPRCSRVCGNKPTNVVRHGDIASDTDRLAPQGLDLGDDFARLPGEREAKLIATSAPSRASRRAVDRPIPRDPPVTRATRFANASDMIDSLLEKACDASYVKAASQINNPMRPPTKTQAAKNPPQSNKESYAGFPRQVFEAAHTRSATTCDNPVESLPFPVSRIGAIHEAVRPSEPRLPSHGRVQSGIKRAERGHLARR